MSVSGKGKGTNVTSKEWEVYQMEGRGRVSGLKKGRYQRGKGGDVYQW